MRHCCHHTTQAVGALLDCASRLANAFNFYCLNSLPSCKRLSLLDFRSECFEWVGIALLCSLLVIGECDDACVFFVNVLLTSCSQLFSVVNSLQLSLRLSPVAGCDHGPRCVWVSSCRLFMLICRLAGCRIAAFLTSLLVFLLRWLA